MIPDKARLLAKSLFKRSEELRPEDVAKARAYISAYWQKLQRFHPKDDESLLGLPKPYLVPAYEDGHEFDFNEMYYWDTYFMAVGLMNDEHKELVVGMLDNLLSLQKRLGIIPNASRTYLTGRSQPPFLTSYIFEVYDRYGLSEKGLKEAIDIAKEEYNTVWMGSVKPNARLVYQGLSRYYDINYLHDLAEAESGWDMTPRFNRKALNYLPIDLNSLLYKYERDFARAALIFGDKREAAKWENTAMHRKEAVDRLMWSNLRGMYFDYNYVKERRGNIASLAGFYPMWAGMADDKQAKQMVKALRRFEHRGGLSATDSQPLNQMVPGKMPTQWAYPNGWAPLHYIIVKGLQRYDYHSDAERIQRKWVKNNLDWFNQHGVFLEKYNVVQPDKPPLKGVYPSQTGFGWTNAVFESFCKDLFDDRRG
jgi:alpha,alpha-trehalase